MNSECLKYFRDNISNPFDEIDLENMVDYLFQNELKVIRGSLESSLPFDQESCLDAIRDTEEHLRDFYIDSQLKTNEVASSDNPIQVIFNIFRSSAIASVTNGGYNPVTTRGEITNSYSFKSIVFFLKLHSLLKYIETCTSHEYLTEDVDRELKALHLYNLDFIRVSIAAGECVGLFYGQLVSFTTMELSKKDEKSKAGRKRGESYKEVKDFCREHYHQVKKRNPSISFNKSAHILSEKIDSEFTGNNPITDYSRIDTLRKWVRAFDKGDTN